MPNRMGPIMPGKGGAASRAVKCRFGAILPVLAIALAISGCSSRLGQFNGSLRDVGGTSAPAEAGTANIESLARRYDADPGNKAVSIAYGGALRARGQFQQAAAVLQRASIVNVGDKEVASAYGRALGDVGRFDEAMRVLGQAHSADRPDWRVLSSQGVVSDQMGQHSRAREFYAEALKIVPDHPSVLSNLGLSYLLTRDIAKAEEMLARAASMPNADARIAANLTMVRGLRSQVGAAPANRPAAPKATPKAAPKAALMSAPAQR
jgi:Flp pilus assembly protein TadD